MARRSSCWATGTKSFASAPRPCRMMMEAFGESPVRKSRVSRGMARAYRSRGRVRARLVRPRCLLRQRDPVGGCRLERGDVGDRQRLHVAGARHQVEVLLDEAAIDGEAIAVDQLGLVAVAPH